MKKGSLFSTAMLAAMLLGGVAACGGGGGSTVTLWVGEESSSFYKTVATEFAKQYKEEGGASYKIKVVGVDTGSTGGLMTSDASSCGDIVVTAHDNIGKIVDKGLAIPLTRPTLVAQIEADNNQSFQSVCKYKDPQSENKYYYASPFISQALFLYYNKANVTEEQAKTFEGLSAAAAAAGNKKAFTITGTDGFNYSFNLLARKASDNSTTLKLYENFEVKNCWAQGEDEVASLQWAKRVFNEANGGLLPSDAGWASDLQNGKVLSVIGGAWHYNAFEAAVGKSNVGIAPIPTYTLTASDVAGTSMSASTVMQGGTFADCKVFLINAAKGIKKLDFEQALVEYLSSKAVQIESFVQCKNVPAYDGALEDIQARAAEIDPTVLALAAAQNKMAEYGIAQPFITGTLNTRFYQKQAPDIYKNYVAGTISDTARQVLYKMEHIWVTGKDAETVPAVLPSQEH